MNNDMKSIKILMTLSCLLICGCVSGQFQYTQPLKPVISQPNFVVLEKPKDIVWKELIPAVGKAFWVINNLDKASGLINISYQGDPLLYVDCGSMKSFVNHAGVPRKYEFLGSSSDTFFETVEHGSILTVRRKLSLEGRVNLILEELTPGQTKITASSKYILSKTSILNPSGGTQYTEHDTISFNSNQGSVFSKGGTICYANGKLEASLLQMVPSK